MDTFQAIQERRSVKHFDPNHQMTDAEINTLLGAAILSPTSFNIQHWRFVVVRNPELRQQIRAAAWDQAQVTEASIVILLCGDVKAWAKDPQRYWRNAPAEVQNVLVPMIGSFYEGKEQLARDEVMRSTGIAGQTIMLTAKAMGYDSCPMIGFDSVKVAEIIKLPEDYVISFMITVGKAAQPARPRGGQLLLEEVMVYDHF
ncbi:nitroreductase family protein [Spirulina subsalsa FACHB-351]|uniref:Nitroreductase family protein n=1 Tax=Spirulina subsalsa FACHB-351 TaxID=234711 RepID=A0ABT3L7P2_9CYAN|nr:nitroreductase family protein [Spirulina subsalsa]MCW6037521.1 nitroreductase family protein [Spirulina subsalsa FACHB-351]